MPAFNHLLLPVLIWLLLPAITRAQSFSITATDTFTTLTIGVTGPHGTAVPHATVQVVPHSRYGQHGRILNWATLPLHDTGYGDIQTTVGEVVLVKAQAPNFAPAYRIVNVTGHNAVEPVTITLSEGTKLTGQFHHAGGKTVTSGIVTLNFIKLNNDAPYGRLGNMIIDYEDEIATAPVQADGSFTVDNVPAGSLRVKLDAPQFDLEDIRNQEIVGIPNTATHTVGIPVLEAGYVAGRVTDPEGNPVPNAYVRISAGEDDRITLGSTQSDDNGRYRVEGVPDIPYYALVSGPGVKNDYTARSGINVDGVDIICHKPTVAETRTSATAIVSDGAARGIENFTVEVVDQYTGDRAIQVDYDQPYGITLRSDQLIYERAIRVSAPGYAAVTQRMNANDKDKRFILPKAVRLFGAIVDGATGAGIPNAKVWSVHNSNYGTSTAEDGTFDFPEFPAGFAELDITPPLEYRKNAEQMMLDSDVPETSVTIPLTRAGLLKIELVQLPGSTPVASEPLELEGKVVRTSSSVRGIGPTRYGKTQPDGTYDHYDSGHPVTIALPQRNLKITLPETLQPGEVREITIPLVSSTITMDTGRGEMTYFYGTATIDGLAYEYASDYHRNDYLVATDHAGQAVIRDLPPGQWTFYFIGSGLRPSRRDGTWATHGMTVPEQGNLAVKVMP